ncbi:hypothetical protein BASA50_005648 [Batrachochytrium salamandrivorans]|uniref:Tail specific protease domain-containing protein n=1 Tax=Batrachochytrium salamandrivorans TaxID=1357716 RepID=A0ABQ8FC33_9FUNG|nr:hypothetical protein BASA50_005648 [Batrachochytrium salamandrivorans]
MLVSPLIALLAISATSVSASDYATYNLLKDDRDAGRLVFPPTTLDQREVILSNVDNAFTMWANYDSKILNYGPASDPFPTIKNLRKNIETITDEDLQLGLTDAFTMIRDHHTRWINVAPYSCFYSTTGVRFSFIEGDVDIAKNPTVVVTSTSTNPEVRSLFGKGFSKIQAGDQLLAVNGLSFVDWFEQNKFTSGGGANEFGGQRSALRFLSTRYGETNRLPSEDSITFKFKSRTNPQNSYTVKIPYVSGHDEECWGFGSNLYKNLTGITLPGTPPMSWPFSAEHLENNHESNATHLSSRGYGTRRFEKPEREAAVDRIFPKQKSTVTMNPTNVTKITWGIYRPDSANMGVINLEDFSPEDIDTNNPVSLKAIMVVRSLLVNELKDTNSVIYELRGNPGGIVSFSDGMVQLFKPDFHPFGDRYLMNNVTYNIFVKDKDPNLDPFAKAWQETEPGSRFTNALFSNTMKSANTLGQAYVRPMGVFNDGLCYSSCEVFSGSIQSHGVGTIFGEDGQTGGGGAAVLNLDPVLLTASPSDFQKFPFSNELTNGSTTYANALTVGSTQTVRVGRYSDRDIEDLGVETEVIFRPRWSDLQPNSTTNSQYDRIAEHLARVGRKNGQSKLHFVSEPFEIEKPLGKFSLDVETAGIDVFTVLQNDGKTVVAQQRVATKKHKFSLPVSAVATTLGNSQITILGKAVGKQVLKTIRSVRSIPTDDDYMKIGTPGFTFSGLSDSVGLYQSPVTAPTDGWNNVNGSWMIGNGIKYVENIESSLEAFFTSPVGTKVNVGLDVALDTEPEFDFLYLSVKSSGDVEDFLINSKGVNDITKTFDGVSGGNMTVKGIFPFTTKSEKFSVALKFVSDEGLEFSGATIRSFTVSSA